MDPAIELRGVTKAYTIDPRVKSNLRERLTSEPVPIAKRIIHALDDVNLTVEQGAVVGIVGDNGSGKSTLLKLISGITQPTDGSVTVRGRVGSILEVGTGFHPDLSGRENIYLSGNLLGMSRAEVTSRVQDIIDFSEIGDFIDTPVKFYSSGMFMRLAFSVIVHLDADILLLDEVFSVGDAGFRRKSERKLNQLSSTDRTILLVSHDIGNIVKVCDDCLILEQGRITAHGPAREIVDRYFLQGFEKEVVAEDHHTRDSKPDDAALDESQVQDQLPEEDRMNTEATVRTEEVPREEVNEEPRTMPDLEEYRADPGFRTWTPGERPRQNGIELISVEVRNAAGRTKSEFGEEEEVRVVLRYTVDRKDLCFPAIYVSYGGDAPALICNPRHQPDREKVDEALRAFRTGGRIEAECELPANWLNHGIFVVSVYFLDGDIREVFRAERLLYFRIRRDMERRTARGDNGRYMGPFNPMLAWRVTGPET